MTRYHVAPEDLRECIRGASGSIAAVSVEQHVASCPTCRADVATLVASTPVEAVPDLTDLWSRVRDDIELTPASPVERLLTRLGLSRSDAALVAAAPSLRGPWLTALGSALLFVTVAAVAESAKGTALFLMVAPLVPAFAVALAYGPEASPALEQESAVPYPLGQVGPSAHRGRPHSGRPGRRHRRHPPSRAPFVALAPAGRRFHRNGPGSFGVDPAHACRGMDHPRVGHRRRLSLAAVDALAVLNGLLSRPVLRSPRCRSDHPRPRIAAFRHYRKDPAISAPTVRLTGVDKRFRGTVALADVDLTLKPGITPDHRGGTSRGCSPFVPSASSRHSCAEQSSRWLVS
jgi:hypothetical protein